MKTFTDNYLRWFKENTTEELLPTGWTAIGTPFLDRHNDGITVYVKEERGEVTLSDDGYILADMEMSGVNVNRRMKSIVRFLQSYGINVNDNKELTVKATIQNYPIKQHLLLQAMMSVSDMFTPSAHSNSGVIFLDDVCSFFASNDIFATQDVQFQGKSGLIHKVDFIIPKSKSNPERFVYAINTPRYTNIMSTIFMWEDIQKVRPVSNRMIAMLNDNKAIRHNAIAAFSNYTATPICWSDRMNYVNDLKIA